MPRFLRPFFAARVLLITSSIILSLFFKSNHVYATEIPTTSFIYPTNVSQNGKFETGLNLSGTFDNPFDLSDVSVMVHFLAPSTKEYVIPAFWYQNYNQCNYSNQYMTTVGNPYFMVRYTPKELGEYKWWVVIKDKNGERILPQNKFQTITSEKKGFIKISSKNSKYFSFEDGSTFYPIGQNVAWASFPSDNLPPNPIKVTYENIFSNLSKNNANFARVWMGISNSHNKIENNSIPMGKFDLARSWCLDQILNYSEKYNIYLNLTINYHGELSTNSDANWTNNPYNSTNGGPCSTPNCFWTDLNSKKFYKQKLDYINSRYGYSPFIAYYEFWNEVDISDSFDPTTYALWHTEMTNYLKNKDINKHLISVSFSGEGPKNIFTLQENDIIQNHVYSPINNYAQAFGILSRQKYTYYPNKPYIIGEYGASGKDELTDNIDTTGVHIHNGIWSSLFNLASGTPLIWWWDKYVEPKNLYYHYKPFATFISDIKLAQSNYKPVKVDLIDTLTTPRIKTLKITGPFTYYFDEDENKPINVNIDSDGNISNELYLNRILNNQKHNDPAIYNPTSFTVNYKEKSDFSVIVDKPYYGGTLVISVDGIKIIEKAQPITGYTIPNITTIQIPAGIHTVEVKNNSGGYYGAEYNFKLTTKKPALDIYAITDNTLIKDGDIPVLIWLKNENYNWSDIYNLGLSLSTINNAKIQVPGLIDGNYKIKWFDAQTGNIISELMVNSQNGLLETTVPPVIEDIAAKIYKIGTSTTPTVNNYDINKDGLVNLVDVLEVLAEIFK